MTCFVTKSQQLVPNPYDRAVSRKILITFHYLCKIDRESITLRGLVLGNVNSRRHIRDEGANRKADQKNYDGLKGWSEAVTYEASEGMALVTQRSDRQVFD
jgi:hypothetical protein